MKNWIIVGIVFISLIGLVLVQYHYLRAGLLLERSRLDQRIGYVLDEVYLKLARQGAVRDMAMRVMFSEQEPLASPEYLLPEKLEDSIQLLIRSFLAGDSVRMDYAFALTDETGDQTFLKTDNYTSGAENELTYQRKVEGLLSGACGCIPTFHLQIKNTVNYLLGRLAYLVVPSVLFILLLAGCLGLLIYYLNRQQRLDAVKNDFINNLTHELKTPVFSIGMLSRMIRGAVDEGQPEKVLEYASLIEQENRLVKDHVDRVLELATLEGPSYQMEKSPTDLHSLVEEAARALQPQLQSLEGEMVLELDAEDSMLPADRTHLRNVILNLLDNAIKYRNGPPQIHITTRREGRGLILSVADRGIGIPGAHHHKVFEKFYRVPAGDLHEVKGFGLGLSYVQQIVRAHQGHIQLWSRVGEGTRFDIWLPAA